MTVPELEQLVLQLQQEIQSLKNSATIPYDVGEAFKDRILSDQSFLTVSGKSASSENVSAVVSVNFGASSTTTNTVLDNPDGFFQQTINGTIYYVPYYL